MQLHHTAKITANQRAALNCLRQRPGADDFQRGCFWVGIKERAGWMILIRILHRDQAGGAEIARGPVAALVKDLVIIVKRHAPAIVPRLAAIEESIHLLSARVEAPHARLFQHRQSVSSLHPREGMQPLSEPERAVRTMADRVHQLMRVPDSEA